MDACKQPQSAEGRNTAGRWAHRRTCMLAGGLAVLGGVLGLLIDPMFVALAALGGIWLMIAPETSCCSSPTTLPPNH